MQLHAATGASVTPAERHAADVVRDRWIANGGDAAQGETLGVICAMMQEHELPIRREMRAHALLASGWVETPESEAAGEIARALAVVDAERREAAEHLRGLKRWRADDGWVPLPPWQPPEMAIDWSER